MINKSRIELVTSGFKPRFPERQLCRFKSCADGTFSYEFYEEDKHSILRSKDFDVQTLLDTNPALLKPVALLRPDRLVDHDNVSRVAVSLSDQLPSDLSLDGSGSDGSVE